MKGIVKGVSFFIIVFSLTIFVSANAGPTFWQGYPSSSVMLIDEDSPIRVDKENLIFDFTDEGFLDYSINARVTANYKMSNPTGEISKVQMAFPFIASIDRLIAKDIVVSFDKKEIPYNIYIGSTIRGYAGPFSESSHTNYDFVDILNTITNEAYRAESFKQTDKGKLYTIDVKPGRDQGINFAIDFDFDYEKTNILIDGFNGYGREDGKTKLTAWCYKAEILEIFVLGGDINFKVSGYMDGGLEEKTDLFDYEVLTDEVEIGQYLMTYINSDDEKDKNQIRDTQLYNLYARALDEYWMKHAGLTTKNDLLSEQYQQRILTLVYTVEFLENSYSDLCISYNTSGTMDRRKTPKPLYSFDYILNPAKNWESFKDLNIEIIPPAEAPYIVDSNIQFTKKDGIYTAILEDLPEDDLTFTLYEKEKVGLSDKILGSLQRKFGYFTPIIVGAIIIFIIASIILIIFKSKKTEAR